MDIRIARKIAKDVGGDWAYSDRRNAFWKLATSKNLHDQVLARRIWDFFGNLGVKGKRTN